MAAEDVEYRRARARGIRDAALIWLLVPVVLVIASLAVVLLMMLRAGFPID